jgi:hypothetical protein
MVQHDPGLPTSPLVRYILRVARSGTLLALLRPLSTSGSARELTADTASTIPGGSRATARLDSLGTLPARRPVIGSTFAPGQLIKTCLHVGAEALPAWSRFSRSRSASRTTSVYCLARPCQNRRATKLTMPESARRRTDHAPTMPSLDSPTTVAIAPMLAESGIAQRAFELYCDRGRQDGHDVEEASRRVARAKT